MPRQSALSDGGDICCRPSADDIVSCPQSLDQTEAPAGAGGFCVREAECQLLSELWGKKASGTAADVVVTLKQEVAERDALTAVRSHYLEWQFCHFLSHMGMYLHARVEMEVNYR